jgi:flavorubredoxin
MDDILVTGEAEREHMKSLEEVIRTLEKAKFHCNFNKSEFLKDEMNNYGTL